MTSCLWRNRLDSSLILFWGVFSAVPTGDAVSLLEESTRNGLLNDLYELQAFLEQREKEWGQSSRSGGLGLLLLEAENKSDSLQGYDSEKIHSLQKAVSACIASLNAPEARRMYTLRSSPRALERAVKALDEKRYIAQKM